MTHHPLRYSDPRALVPLFHREPQFGRVGCLDPGGPETKGEETSESGDRGRWELTFRTNRPWVWEERGVGSECEDPKTPGVRRDEALRRVQNGG